MRSRIFAVLTMVVGAISLFTTSSALASTNCVTQPATVTIVENTSSSSTSTTHTHIEVKKTEREQVKQFEKAHNVIVAIRQHRNGVKSSKHCKDPVKAGWIKPGDPFKNTRHDKSSFTGSWENGRKICKFKIIHRGGKTIAKGTKDDCGNEGIEIVIHGEKPKPQTRQVVEFRTVQEFRSVYDKWVTVTNNSSSNSTGTFSMQYSCNAGFTLIEDGLCRKCEEKPQPPAAPSVGNVTQPQEVYVNETYPNISADVSAPTGHNVRVVFSAKYGNFPDSTFTYSGGFARLSKTYYAPGDVTPTGTDTITVTVYDLTTSLNSSASSNPFAVWPAKTVCC